MEASRDIAIGSIRNVGVELHRQAGGGVAEPVLDDSRMLAGLDHQRRGDVAETVEGERRVETGALNGRREGPRREAAAKRRILRPREHEIVHSAAGITCDVGPPARRAGTVER